MTNATLRLEMSVCGSRIERERERGGERGRERKGEGDSTWVLKDQKEEQPASCGALGYSIVLASSSRSSSSST